MRYLCYFVTGPKNLPEVKEGGRENLTSGNECQKWYKRSLVLMSQVILFETPLKNINKLYIYRLEFLFLKFVTQIHQELERNNLRNIFFNSNEIMEHRTQSFKYSVEIESSYFAAGTQHRFRCKKFKKICKSILTLSD